MRVEFKVLGRPQPAGSKKGFKNPKTGRIIIVDDAKNSRPWKQQVAGTASSHRGHELLTGPLMLDVTFVLQRPKGHYRTGKNSHLLRDSAPEYPTVKPDTTKLLRAVEDALNGIVWRDDAQVVTQIARKVYGSPERMEVRIDELDAGAALTCPPLPGQIALSA
jgi:Holliday junction resolvase RusA-like endonuclease